MHTSTALANYNIYSFPIGSFDAYVRCVSNIPLLTAQEEVVLAGKFRTQGDLSAARKLVLSNLRFVVHITRSYLNYGLPQEDLVQEGNIGLMKAVKNFNPEKGVRLISFAVYWIKAEINEYVLKNWRIVKVATTKSQRKLFFKLRDLKNKIRSLLGNSTAVEAGSILSSNNSALVNNQIAKRLNVSVEDVEEMEGRIVQGKDMSLCTIGVSSEDFSNHEKGMIWETSEKGLSDDRYSPVVMVNNHEDEKLSQERKRQLILCLNKLDDRSREIVMKRWLEGPKTTLEQLAEKYSISAERVRQIETRAMKSIKDALRKVSIFD